MILTSVYGFSLFLSCVSTIICWLLCPIILSILFYWNCLCLFIPAVFLFCIVVCSFPLIIIVPVYFLCLLLILPFAFLCFTSLFCLTYFSSSPLKIPFDICEQFNVYVIGSLFQDRISMLKRQYTNWIRSLV